jgi:hypothetical protein
LEPLLSLEKEYGLRLGKALFADEIRDAFNRAVAEAKAADDLLHVLLHIEADDLRSLHWEKLHAFFDRGWDYLLLNQGTPFSLYLPSKIARRFSPISRRDLQFREAQPVPILNEFANRSGKVCSQMTENPVRYLEAMLGAWFSGCLRLYIVVEQTPSDVKASRATARPARAV